MIHIAVCVGIAAWILSIVLRGQSRERLGAPLGTPPRWVPNSWLTNLSIVVFCLGVALTISLGDSRPPALDLFVTVSLVVLVLSTLARDVLWIRRSKD